MLKGTYDIISGVAEQLIPHFSKSFHRLRWVAQRRAWPDPGTTLGPLFPCTYIVQSLCTVR